MIEYLNPEDWSLHVIDGENECAPENWILVPEGADELFRFKCGETEFYKELMKKYFSKTKGIWSDVKYSTHPVAKLWQRESKNEVVELIGVDATLAERQAQYGCFEDVAFVTENIISVLKRCNYDEMPNPHKMAIYMIASKMARLVSGDCNHLDSWHDIGGYSKLIENLIEGK